MSTNLPTTYDPKNVEEKWYKVWENNGYFHAEVDKTRTPFSIVMPPPNVTGSLHLGHALDNTLQDILTRWRRMQGYNTLWLPGTDHAGIATQAKVEEQLAKEGFSKYDLGREKFLERVWDWKHQYGNRITQQLRKLGTSCDWQRERFTLDEGCSKAVQEVFVRLYEKGLIYQGNYIINWCPKCQTTISDIEVEHEPKIGKIWHIKYPVIDSDEYIVVATTRPETMLGDTGVAVHPEDERYRHLIGKKVMLPLMDRAIPIFADEYVDKEFGSGAVKVTPAHDPNDFEMGLRHNLEQVVVMDREAFMNENAGNYQGMSRYEARERIVQDLKAMGLLVKVEEHEHAVGQCYRCDTVVEPMISKQWFVKMKPLAEPAIQAVLDGRTRFVPERFTKIYLNWMENIRNWCISRQLWWGHRIPVWYCQDCGEVICAKEPPTSCSKCESSRLEQDPDVLDTWFSSGLWPFSTMGWPEKTGELEHFYPTSVLVTGRDIIFFWVARMIFSALEFMEDVPFREVFIHGLVLDAQGRKMSKSLGNGVDPLEVIEQYGADTLRFMLITGNTPGNDLRFQFERLEAARNFANKIWNASRFALMNLADYEGDDFQPEYTLADRWIMSRFNRAAKEVTRNLERYDLGEAGRVLYEFIWNEFCDWYIELIKPRLYGKETESSKRTAQMVLAHVLRKTMELLHPFMPFITEEIWQHLPHQGETIMLAPWPALEEGQFDEKAEEDMIVIMEVIKAIRNLRSEMNVPPGRKAELILMAQNDSITKALQTGESYIMTLAGISQLEVVPINPVKPEHAVTAVVSGVEIYLPLKGLVDVEKELARLQKELENLHKEVARLAGKLNNPGFVEKAPKDVVEKEKAKLLDYQSKKAAIEERMASLGG
ncbi:valine--tRNA ligase [Thermanaerosceptrum fracticalcis]|uniref:Valine--tRNA ligase n=1 Tax=Thermanaerosceptrum fracticalcis TaxID=1712410 RepID=A0A7G6E663_THEFR|nr:valine--tRNA ligase [Thermanaerosceptrum fracticalcis]QNB47567.1 valine--tRNA ligase [Thermanaerosceptrum fracticalcis]